MWLAAHYAVCNKKIVSLVMKKQLCLGHIEHITKTCLFKYIENFATKKGNFSDKNFWYFYIHAQNIGCGHSLELALWGGSNEYPQAMFFNKIKKIMYTPVNPSFTT